MLHDLDPATGAERWHFDGGGHYGGDLSTSPAILADGTILWPGPGDTLFAVDPHGQLLWKQHFGGFVLSPAVAGDNRVYVADMSGHLAALKVTNGSHRTLWSIALGGTDYGSPGVGPDGTIYTATPLALVAVSDHGSSASVRWRFPVKKMIEVSSAVTPDGIVVLGTNNAGEHGVKPDGTAWFADNSGRVRAIDTRTGKLISTIQPIAPAREHAWTSVAVDARDDTYWGTQKGHLDGYDRDGKQLFSLDTDSGVASYPAIGADGTLYAGTLDGTLYAVGG
ncbi:PQQ-binding-like beta-propeller repeat protein [Glaciihabitans sp. UYNi722]|uniref:PQQ-binding-like beta-propeller repeat protein n=1 Tax=Glaciihabitans sp. UYNi722 TaxID=3156344 RepID=UPI003398F6B0